MADVKQKTSEFMKEVQEWVGNSPYKAITFGGICIVVGYLLNVWPF